MINIVIPTYNRCESIKEFFSRNSWVLNNENYKVIILDNASTDGTYVFGDGLSSKFNNVRVISNKENISAEENVKKAFGLKLDGHLWIMGDRYYVEESDAKLILNEIEVAGDLILLLSLNSGERKSGENKLLRKTRDLFLNRDTMLSASCLSTGIYSESVRNSISRELIKHDSPFPHTYAMGRSLIRGSNILYLTNLSIRSVPGKVNWSYSSKWIETGFKGWYSLIDSIAPSLNPNEKLKAYKMFPMNTSLASFNGTIKRRIRNILFVELILRERESLIKGVGIIDIFSCF